MNNASSSISNADIEILTRQFYGFYLADLVQTSSLALLVYATVLIIPREMEYIWKKPFSLPTLLYLLSRYTPIIGEAVVLTIDLLPSTVPIQSCIILGNIATAVHVLGYLGVQGLLIARAYALCRGNKIITGLLASTFFAGLFFLMFELIISPVCITDSKVTREAALFNLLGNISVVLSDFLVFSVCLYNVWETWKLKRGTGLQRENDLVTILLRQIISRFFFVVSFTLTVIILEIIGSNVVILSTVGAVQDGLSAILLTGFTLDLRYRNSAAIASSKLSLPPIRSVQDVLQHVHQSFLVGMGDHENMDVGNMPGAGPGPQDTSSQSDHQSVSAFRIDLQPMV